MLNERESGFGAQERRRRRVPLPPFDEGADLGDTWDALADWLTPDLSDEIRLRMMLSDLYSSQWADKLTDRAREFIRSVPVTTNAMAGTPSVALGMFYPGQPKPPGTIWIRSPEDRGSYTHEIGHAFDYAFGDRIRERENPFFYSSQMASLLESSPDAWSRMPDSVRTFPGVMENESATYPGLTWGGWHELYATLNAYPPEMIPVDIRAYFPQYDYGVPEIRGTSDRFRYPGEWTRPHWEKIR